MTVLQFLRYTLICSILHIPYIHLNAVFQTIDTLCVEARSTYKQYKS